MDNKFEQLQQDAVVSLHPSELILMSHSTFKVSEFLEAIKRKWGVTEVLGQKWIVEGVKCEILSPSKGWRKGKVRVTLEFSPDEPEVEATQVSNENSEPESPLDDLRQMINQETQQQNS